jgi:hypothetical protein
MRELEDHKVTTLNRECVTVRAVDAKDSDGAHHLYQIDVRDPQVKTHSVYRTMLMFQKGGLQDVGPNGLTDQALLAIVLDRIRGFQSGPFQSPFNEGIIEKLQGTLDSFKARADERASRGVEGVRTA